MDGVPEDEDYANSNDAENSNHKDVNLPSIKQLRQSISYLRQKNQMLTAYLKKYDKWREELIKSTDLFLEVKPLFSDDDEDYDEEEEDAIEIRKKKDTYDKAYKANANKKNDINEPKTFNQSYSNNQSKANLIDFISKRINETDFWPSLSPDKKPLNRNQQPNIQADILQPIPIDIKIQSLPMSDAKVQPDSKNLDKNLPDHPKNEAENDSNDFDFSSSNDDEDIVIETFSQKNRKEHQEPS